MTNDTSKRFSASIPPRLPTQIEVSDNSVVIYQERPGFEAPMEVRFEYFDLRHLINALIEAQRDLNSQNGRDDRGRLMREKKGGA